MSLPKPKTPVTPAIGRLRSVGSMDSPSVKVSIKMSFSYEIGNFVTHKFNNLLSKVPASPMMKRLGYGTGVNVYMLKRHPKVCNSPLIKD